MKKILILAIIASLATFGCKVLQNINLIPASHAKELGQQLNLEIQNIVHNELLKILIEM